MISLLFFFFKSGLMYYAIGLRPKAYGLGGGGSLG